MEKRTSEVAAAAETVDGFGGKGCGPEDWPRARRPRNEKRLAYDNGKRDAFFGSARCGNRGRRRSSVGHSDRKSNLLDPSARRVCACACLPCIVCTTSVYRRVCVCVRRVCVCVRACACARYDGRGARLRTVAKSVCVITLYELSRARLVSYLGGFRMCYGGGPLT